MVVTVNRMLYAHLRTDVVLCYRCGLPLYYRYTYLYLHKYGIIYSANECLDVSRQKLNLFIPLFYMYASNEAAAMRVCVDIHVFEIEDTCLSLIFAFV